MELLVERAAALDVGKDEVVACIRVPDAAGVGWGRGRRQEVRTYPTFTSSLEALADWLQAEGITQVVMEATGQYWKPCVRHEVPRVRAEVKAFAIWLSQQLGQPDPGGAGEGGSSPDNDGTGRHRQMTWVRLARREGASRAEPVVNPP